MIIVHMTKADKLQQRHILVKGCGKAGGVSATVREITPDKNDSDSAEEILSPQATKKEKV